MLNIHNPSGSSKVEPGFVKHSLESENDGGYYFTIPQWDYFVLMWAELVWDRDKTPEPPNCIGVSEMWKTNPQLASFQDDYPHRVLLEHVGHFSSLEKKVQLLHDRRAGILNWNKEHFDALPSPLLAALEPTNVPGNSQIMEPRFNLLKWMPKGCPGNTNPGDPKNGLGSNTLCSITLRWPENRVDRFEKNYVGGLMSVQYVEIHAQPKRLQEQFFLSFKCHRSERFLGVLKSQLLRHLRSGDVEYFNDLDEEDRTALFAEGFELLKDEVKTVYVSSLNTVNVAINVSVDNKKNAFFGVPFEGIIWHNFSLFCPQNLYKKANCNAKMLQHDKY